MTERFDVIVVGLGGMGSAAAAHLAARGLRTLGLEQFTPAHDLGSSHGDTRIVRQAYFEDPAYVPLLFRAYELFADLDRDDPGILCEVGGLMMGTPDCLTVAGSLASARAFDLPHELLDAAVIRARFPVFAPTEDILALYEARAGFVRPERTVRAHLRRATEAGAELHFGEPVSSWTAAATGVTVVTGHDTYRGDHLVLAPGAWAPQLLPDLGVPLTVERQLLHWFDADLTRFGAGQPIFIWERAPGLQFYGFPAVDGPRGGVKVAFFRHGQVADPDRLDRVVHAPEIEHIRGHLAAAMPAAGRHLRSLACMYTTTPDEHFVVGHHPGHSNVVVAAGFSGHGFKFVPVIGEILAELVIDGSTRHPITLFDPRRFLGVG